MINTTQATQNEPTVFDWAKLSQQALASLIAANKALEKIAEGCGDDARIAQGVLEGQALFIIEQSR